MRGILNRPSGRIAAGVLAALVCYLGFAALLAFLLTHGTVGEGRMLICLWLSALLSSFVGGKSATLLWPDRFPAIGSTIALWTVTVFGGFLIYSTLNPARTIQMAAAVALGGVLAMLAKSGTAKKKRAGGRRRWHK